MRGLSAKLRLVGIGVGLSILLIGAVHMQAQAAGDTVDEIHVSYGDDSSQMWVYWHGNETVLNYGLDSSYGQTATAAPGAITPIDMAGPFEQVKLTGLTPGTTYHYKIGANGDDHTFMTAPTGDFTWVDIGDTGSSYYDPTAQATCNKSWMPSVWQQIAAEQPAVVTHGGDISYQNECGRPSINRLFNDIAPVATQAPIEFSWGNHEFGKKTANAPADTLSTDSMANYKGRYNMANAQKMAIDNTTRISPPGCPSPTNAKVNGCAGDDWGYFVAGHALFISYPEPWSDNYAEWKTKADALMAQGEADPNIFFVITYGHRPAYTSSTSSMNTELQAAVNALGDKYSPSGRPDGKYILNIGHHAHQGEAFAPQHGVVSLVNGAGGTEQLSLATPIANELWTSNHFSHLNVQFKGNQLTYNFICGPANSNAPKKAAPCTQGSVLYSQTLNGYQAGPPSPSLRTSLSDGVSSVKVGDAVTYTLQVTNPVAGTVASGVAPSLILPENMMVSDTGGGEVSGNTVSWSPTDLPGSESLSKTVVATLSSGNPGASVQAQAMVTTADSSCQTIGGVCSATDTDTIPNPLTEWVTNPSFETNMSGWAAYSKTGTATRTTADFFDGIASARITRTSTDTANPGIRSQTHWVTSSVAGKAYNAGVWVRPGTTGQKLTFQIKEVDANGTIYATKNFVAAPTSTGWLNIRGSLTAVGNGHEIYLNLFCTNLPIGAWFDADLFSLTSQN